MKILKKKNINEEAEVLVNKQTLDLDKDSLTPTVDHEVTAILLSKEHNEESAKENIEASGIEKVAKEVVDEIQDPKKDTPAPKTPSLKPYTEAKLVVDRKELGALIKESVKAGRSYKIRRSLKEGFRYVFEDFEAEYPECYFVCHSDEDANNENGYFDTLEDAKAYAEANPEICCIFKVCDNEEEKVWIRDELEEEKINIDYVVSLFGDDSHYYKEDDKVRCSTDISGATKFNKKKDISILNIVSDVCESQRKYMPENEVAHLFDLNTLEEVYEKDEDYFINSGLVKIISVYKNKKIELPESLKEGLVARKKNSARISKDKNCIYFEYPVLRDPNDKFSEETRIIFDTNTDKPVFFEIESSLSDDEVLAKVEEARKFVKDHNLEGKAHMIYETNAATRIMQAEKNKGIKKNDDIVIEELKGNDAHNFPQYLYSEILELIREFSDRGITEADLNKAIEFCLTHLKDDPRIPKSFFNNQANVESIENKSLAEAVVTPVSEPGDSLEDVKSSKGYQIECKFKDNSEWCDLDGCDGIDYEIDEASNGELSKYKKKNPTEYVFPTKEIADKFASMVRKYSEKYGISEVRVKENHDESLKEGLKKGQKSFLSMIKKYIDEHNAEDIEEADNIDEFLYNMYFNVLDANEIDIPYSVLKEFCEDPDNISSDEDENIFNFYIVSDELKEKVKKLLDQKFNSSDPEDIVENLSESHEEGLIEEDPEIEIDNIETFEPTDEKAKSTMTTIKDAGEGAMFAFKDTLKDLFNLKIKVSDLQKLLSDSSEWLLDLLGFNAEHEEEIHPEEIPEKPVPVEEPEMVGGEFDEVAPVTDVSTININDFDEVEPVEYEEEEDTNFFVGD